MKECIICKEHKPLDDYYVHKQMGDGHLNKCKDCCKNQAKKRHYKLSENKDWVEKERFRGREKYKRLNYKDRQKELNKNKPWKSSSKYKSLSKKFKTPKGHELHHWNYNDVFLEDVVLMTIKEHRRLHGKLTLDLDKRIFYFETRNGKNYLDTKEKHLDFIKWCKYNYLEF